MTCQRTAFSPTAGTPQHAHACLRTTTRHALGICTGHSVTGSSLLRPALVRLCWHGYRDTPACCIFTHSRDTPACARMPKDHHQACAWYLHRSQCYMYCDREPPVQVAPCCTQSQCAAGLGMVTVTHSGDTLACARMTRDHHQACTWYLHRSQGYRWLSAAASPSALGLVRRASALPFDP